MTGWVEILVVAFIAQLAVLPGEKAQFIIAGLSTQYRPVVVVAAAGSAFAIWTAVELLVGEALQGALPGAAMNALTGGLFLLFAVLLYRSAPAPGETADDLVADGGVFETEASDPGISVFGYEIPPYLNGFVPIFAMMAVGEFGDKTQLVTVGLAIQYGAHPAIWVGEMLAIIPVSIANAYLFNRFSHRFDIRTAHLLGALLFLFFGVDTFLQLFTGFSVWETAVSAVAEAVLAIIR